MARGEAAHEHVERRLASTIDLLVSVLIIGDAALSGGHDPDRAARRYKILQRLDDAHGTEGVGYHHTMNSSVETSAIVSRSSFLTPALTNSRSNFLDARRARSAAT